MQRERWVPVPKQRTHKVEPAFEGRDIREATRAMQKKATSTITVQEQNISATRKPGYILKRICTVRPIPRISYFFSPSPRPAHPCEIAAHEPRRAVQTPVDATPTFTHAHLRVHTICAHFEDSLPSLLSFRYSLPLEKYPVFLFFS